MHILLYALTGLLLLALPLMWWRGWKAGARYGIESAKIEVVHSHEKLSEMLQVAEHCRQQWEEWERKAVGFHSLNSGILTERDSWQHLYTDQSIAHGNAQAMMMSTIDFLGGKLRALGVEVPIPEVLSQVQRDFTTTHVTPMLPKPAPTLSPPAQVEEKVQSQTESLG